MKRLVILLVAILSLASARAQRPADITSMQQPPQGPAITHSGTLANFTTVTGTPSGDETFTFTGTGLTASVTWTAGANMQVSTDGSTWSSTAIYSQSGGNSSGTVHNRVASTAPQGSLSGSVTAASTTASDAVAYTATVSGVPALSVAPTSLSGVNGTVGTAGTPQNLVYTFANLGSNLALTTTTPIEISQDGGSTWNGSSLSVSSGSSPKTINARVAASASAGIYSINVGASATGVSPLSTTVGGTVSTSGKDTFYVNLDTTETESAAHWINYTVDPAKRNFSLTSGAITISSLAANWSGYSGCSGCSAFPDNGLTTSTIATTQVVKECFFSYNVGNGTNTDPYVHNKYKFKVAGLKPSTAYKFVTGGSLNGASFNFSGNTEYRIEGASVNGPETIDCKNNASTITTTFTSVTTDASGNFFIYVNAALNSEMGVATFFKLFEI